MKQTQSEYIAR